MRNLADVTDNAPQDERMMRRRYADASWEGKPAKSVTITPSPGTGELTLDRQLFDSDRPELGWEWCALWLDPPGQPPGFVAEGDYATRTSCTTGARDTVLSQLVDMPAAAVLVRANLVEGLDGDDWVPLPALDKIKKLEP